MNIFIGVLFGNLAGIMHMGGPPGKVRTGSLLALLVVGKSRMDSRAPQRQLTSADWPHRVRTHDALSFQARSELCKSRLTSDNAGSLAL